MDFHSCMQEPINVSSFQAAAAPVTIGEFYQFAVLEGGYAMPELWEPCDFDFFRARGQTLPATWSSQVIPYCVLPVKQPLFSGPAANT
jgi:formylglycine-generating enzyme required for sulfatase activity